MYGLFIKKGLIEVLPKSAHHWQIYDKDGNTVIRRYIWFSIAKYHISNIHHLDGYMALDEGEYYLEIPDIDNPKQKDWQYLIKPTINHYWLWLYLSLFVIVVCGLDKINKHTPNQKAK